MDYLVETFDGDRILEKVVFSYREEALRFADARRKLGYIVTVKVIK